MRPVKRFLFVERGRWQLVLVVSVVAAVVLLPTYENDSLWLAPGVAGMVLLGWHSLVAGRRLPWIPGLALGTAALQWIIAPWLTYHIGPYFPAFGMAVPAPIYFGYAVPALCALAAGMLGTMRKLGRNFPPVAEKNLQVTAYFRRTCDLLLLLGVVTQLVLAPLLGGSLAFVGVLVSNLAFVGALALLLARSPGWPLRVAVVLGAEGLVSAASGMFHDLVLWTSYFVLTAIYVYRLRIRTIAVLVGAGMAVVMVLNVVKREFRASLENTQPGMLGSAAMLGSTMMENAADPEFAYEGNGFKANVTRLNQGWIISRVLYWVPDREPYAQGETISATLRATLLPRILDPNKLQLGGRTYFERFTGMPLRRTSMDLSVAGETYANFGYWGGLLGVFIFGAFIGLVYSFFLRLGYRSRLWWAWAPYVLLYATRAENSIAEVTNHVAKSALVMLAVISILPAWSMLRRPLRAQLARTLRLPTRPKVTAPPSFESEYLRRPKAAE
jgi:hypothetical protein